MQIWDFQVFCYICDIMPYKVKTGKKDFFNENFSTEREAKQAKYFAIVGAKNNRSAFRAMDAKIVKVAKKKKK